ncbi:MAG: hypothetical protein Q8L39_17735 [Burkholderiales bacterium]|nr:hypothetical protein [Burkholderiales bacterium]
MRALVLLTLLTLACAASAADSLSVAQQLYQAGAPQLAYARVVREQPEKSEIAGWYDWESLRLTLLSDTHRPAEIIERAKHYPQNAPREFQQKTLGHAAWAHLELQQGVAARALLAQLIWRFELNPADHQWARRLVIRSYLIEHKADEAYRAMLRYQQDFQPLPKEVAAEFAQGLLREERATEAMTWLAELDPTSPATLALLMKVGLIAPDAAIAQARAALQKQPTATAYATLIADGADMLKDNRMQVGALEQLLGLPATAEQTEAQLWRAYLKEAQTLGNRAQLLQGDDASWLELALRTETSDALGARSLFAYVAQHGVSIGVRETALSRLYAALLNAPLEEAAVRLFNAAPWGEKVSIAQLQRLIARAADGLPQPAARKLYFSAGRILEARQDAIGAADFYAQAVLKSDLRAPDLLATQALQRAVAMLERVGFKDDAVQFYRSAISQKEPTKKAPPAKLGKRKK